MATLKLIYFPLKGRGEAIRLLLIDNNAEYEETTVPFDKWVPEWKPKMTFGQLPCLYDGDFQLVQSCAILRYLGRKFGMYGDNDTEKATVDMINDHVEEIRGQYVKMIYQNYEAGKDPYIAELPNKFTPLESYGPYIKIKNPDFAKFPVLEQMGQMWHKLITDYSFMAGSKICWADYNLFELLTTLLVLSPTCLDAFPKLQAYRKRVEAREGVQKRINSEDCKNMPINGNGKQ